MSTSFSLVQGQVKFCMALPRSKDTHYYIFLQTVQRQYGEEEQNARLNHQRLNLLDRRHYISTKVHPPSPPLGIKPIVGVEINRWVVYLRISSISYGQTKCHILKFLLSNFTSIFMHFFLSQIAYFHVLHVYTS